MWKIPFCRLLFLPFSVRSFFRVKWNCKRATLCPCACKRWRQRFPKAIEHNCARRDIHSHACLQDIESFRLLQQFYLHLQQIFHFSKVFYHFLKPHVTLRTKSAEMTLSVSLKSAVVVCLNQSCFQSRHSSVALQPPEREDLTCLSIWKEIFREEYF